MVITNGFKLVREVPIGSDNSTLARLFRHTQSGARLLSIQTNDENKSFGVAFSTPPSDHTGLPHILEHSVLAGSAKYPLKEPFVELLKTSHSTFLNAMTYPDMTIYPVASTNTKDLYNLIAVYLDAVFHPLLAENTFKQEGWHYELEDTNMPLSYKGVVYNEMKGYFSSPEVVLSDEIRSHLYPDTPYAFNSGGNPAHIPSLSYEQFVTFHQTYYNPTNALFFFYGDDEESERLRYLGAFLDEFSQQPPVTTIPPQARWQEPQSITLKTDMGDENEDGNKSLVSMSWLLTDVTSHDTQFELSILSRILLGMNASPLRIALLDSELGEDVIDDGLDMYAKETSFTVGLKGTLAEQTAAIESLIMNTLHDLAQEGIDPATIKAAMNATEFELRERNSGRFPRGLVLFTEILPIWIHGGDVFSAMDTDSTFQRLKDKLAHHPRLFEDHIKMFFLQNTHRLTLTLIPDPQVKVERELAERNALEAKKTQLSDTELKKIIEETKQLKQLQETPDSPEALATLPTLTLMDMNRHTKATQREHEVVAEVPVIYHPLDTNGVLYIDLALELHALPQKYLPYLALFAQALGEIGTKDQNYIQFSQRLESEIGGLAVMPFASKHFTTGENLAYLVIQSKALPHQIADLFAIWHDILHHVSFADKDRLKQMVLENKASFEMNLGMMGHMLANTRLRAHMGEAGSLNEQMNGVSSLLFLRDLAARFENDWEEIRAIFEQMHKILVNRHNSVLNVTANTTVWQEARSQLKTLLETIPNQARALHAWQFESFPKHEGLSVPTQVNFVGKGANLYELGYQLSGAHLVILKRMNLDYLWTKIRVQGGAYGGAFVFDALSGGGTFLSWQDPNITETLKSYDATATWLRNLELSESELEKAIIGTIGDLDAYRLPDAKGFADFTRVLCGITDELRQQWRDEVFRTTLKDFTAMSEVFSKVAKYGFVVVTGAPKALETANQAQEDKLSLLKLM